MTKPHGEIEMLEKIMSRYGAGSVIMCVDNSFDLYEIPRDDFWRLYNAARAHLAALKANRTDWSIQSTTTEDTAI